MKLFNASLASILTTVIVTVAGTYSAQADAAIKRLTPSAFCQAEDPIMELFGSTQERVRRQGPRLINVWGENSIICGYPSDGSLSHSNVKLIKIRGYRSTNGEFDDANARACVGTFIGNEVCGYSTFLADGSGNFTIEIDDISKWGNSHWYPYLKITLQPGDRLYGIVITD